MKGKHKYDGLLLEGKKCESGLEQTMLLPMACPIMYLIVMK